LKYKFEYNIKYTLKMFRGGDYVDKPDFKDLVSKPGKNYMDTSDIPGA
jgi:hypothetical protein